LAALPLLVAAAGDPSKPGAYCPLPEPGQKPVCLGPAEATYSNFFAALDEGEVDEESTARVAADLGSSERAHLAVSSLAYGYYHLAHEASVAPEANPTLAARLEQWNELLASAYRDGAPEARETLREAAADLHARVPAVAVACGDHVCSATESLVHMLEAVDSAAGIRSPLAQLLGRIFGGEPP